MIRDLYNRACASARNLAERGKVAAVSFLTAGSLVATNAHAAITLDSTEILADIATVVTFIGAVGLGVLGMVYAAKAYKWARRAG